MASPARLPSRRLAALVLGLAFVTPTQAHAATFYVDPANGSPDGDGSDGNPWRTLEEVLSTDLVETRAWAELPYEEGAQLEVVNPGAPVRAGDTLRLRSGYHGALFIESAYNAEPITIEADAGQTPLVASIHLRSAANWIIRGLSVSPEHAPVYEPPGDLVFIEDHSFRGPSYDITITNCELYSMADATGWSQQNWNDLTANGVRVDGDRVTIRDNVIRNVNFGISVGGEYALIAGNVVDGFAGDGLRGLGDYGVFEYNTVMNCYAVNDNHDDGFQSWSVGADGVGTGEVVGLVLRGNTIINYTDPDQPFRCTLQGIGCFDGMFRDWVVENNVVMTDHWHGITLLGAIDGRIVNNTVIDLNDESPGPPWISVGDHKDGRASTGTVVRNNLTTDLAIDGHEDGASATPDGVVVDSNRVIDAEDFEALFVDASAGDLHLATGAPVIDEGSSELAPALDRDGIPRPQGEAVDIGAYEWFEGTPEVPDPAPDAGGTGGPDIGGPGTPDAGGPGTPDTGSADSGGSAGGGSAAGTESGCACRQPTGQGLGLGWALLLAGLLLQRRRWGSGALRRPQARPRH